MHSAKRAFLAIVRNVALSDEGIEAMRLEFFATERARERSAFVLERFNFNDISAFEFCFVKDH